MSELETLAEAAPVMKSVGNYLFLVATAVIIPTSAILVSNACEIYRAYQSNAGRPPYTEDRPRFRL
jgi:hypothetical protein